MRTTTMYTAPQGADSERSGNTQATGARGINRLFTGIAFATAMIVTPHDALAMAVDLGAAGNFAALAGSGITFSGSGMTTLTGDIGSSPTPSITGLANLILTGNNHAGDAITQQAKLDLATAYTTAAGRTPTLSYGAIFDLGGLTLTPGVYNGSSSFGITGVLTLDAQNNSDAIWIFQAGSTLTAAKNSKVLLVNGAKAENVIWLAGSSATLNTEAYFTGTILAQTSISLDTGATVMGGLLAQTGAVTFNGNTVMVPEGSTVQLLVLGMVGLLTHRRRFFASV